MVLVLQRPWVPVPVPLTWGSWPRWQEEMVSERDRTPPVIECSHPGGPEFPGQHQDGHQDGMQRCAQHVAPLGKFAIKGLAPLQAPMSVCQCVRVFASWTAQEGMSRRLPYSLSLPFPPAHLPDVSLDIGALQGCGAWAPGGQGGKAGETMRRTDEGPNKDVCGPRAPPVSTHSPSVQREARSWRTSVTALPLAPPKAAHAIPLLSPTNSVGLGTLWSYWHMGLHLGVMGIWR